MVSGSSVLPLLLSKDVNALEKQINDDCNQGKTPLLVIAYAGNPVNQSEHVLVSTSLTAV